MAANAPILEGVFAINKPPAITSAEVLRILQTHFNTSTLFAPLMATERSRLLSEAKSRRKRNRQPLRVKLGHGGTLDPLATGVLIVGVGNGTKSLQKFLECTKEYECVVLFGVATDTYDISGKVVGLGRADVVEGLKREMVEEALGKFRGEIWQRPPVYSALRVDGKRMYEYAREGGTIPEVNVRRVEVKSLELIEWMEGGSHEYKLPQEEVPEEEAPEEEKAAAMKLANINSQTPISKNPNQSPETHAIKRKRESPGTDNEQDLSSFKKSKPAPELPEHGPEPPTPSANSVIAPHPSKQTPPPMSPPVARLRMTVTSGFYVRSLCHDLGNALGALGVMASLVRTRQADFTLGRNVLEFEKLAEGEEDWGPRLKGMLEGWTAKQDEGSDTDGMEKGHRGGNGKRRSRERWRESDDSKGRRRRNSSSDG